MRINGFSGTNMQSGTMGMAQGNDSVSKNIQNQIANAKQKLQEDVYKRQVRDRPNGRTEYENGMMV